MLLLHYQTFETMANEDKRTPKDKASEKYPGVAVNIGDDEKVNESLEKERTCTLNNNPRNNK